MIALVAVFGISWMAETMFTVHTPMMKAALGDVVKAHPLDLRRDVVINF